MPVEQDYQTVATFLKHLKPVLDHFAEGQEVDESLCKECEELDAAVNEAREFLEKWTPKKSRLLCVLQGDLCLMKIHSSAVKITCFLCRIFEKSTSSLSPSDAQEAKNLSLGKVSECLKRVLEAQKEGTIPDSEHLMTIIKSLNLTSSQELLNEHIILEKERMRAEDNKMKGELDQINHILSLVSHIHDRVVNLQNFEDIRGLKVPPYFCCPLSLEIMSDPVIVASGQTYERAAIQKWLDNGLNMCPRTRQKLFHTNLIPNYTVKALIANWCEENKITLSKARGGINITSLHSQFQCTNLEDKIKSPQPRKNSTPRSSAEVGCGLDKQKHHGSLGPMEGRCCVLVEEAEKSGHSSPEHSYVHSRTESASSAISSIDYLPTALTETPRVLSKQDNASDRSGDIVSDCFLASHSSKNTGLPAPSAIKQYHSSKTMGEMTANGNHYPSRSLSLRSESDTSDLTTSSHVEKLIEDLKSESTELQTAAAEELRYLAKYNTENRLIIGSCGVIAPLISLLYSNVKLTQEHAVTALLNLSINEKIKAMIAEGGALEPLINVLKRGSAGAKENAAATLFSLSVLDDYRVKIGRSGAVKALVDLLRSGTLRGKKDAATALFNLSISHENKARIVQAGAVKYLVELMNPETEMVDKAVALLANLSTIPEGCKAIAREGGIPLLIEIVESGSQRGKENASSVLLQLCISSTKYCRVVLQEGAVPPLVALSQSGTPRAKEKAQQLLGHFRNQREGGLTRGRS